MSLAWSLKAKSEEERKSIDRARELLAEEDRLEQVLERQTKQRRQQQEILSNINSLASDLTGIDMMSVASL